MLNSYFIESTLPTSANPFSTQFVGRSPGEQPKRFYGARQSDRRQLRHAGFVGAIAIFILILTNQIVFAQSARIRFNHFSIEDGLSHNSVNCVLQDSYGFMWFGTNDGLNRYDGYAFTVVQPTSSTGTTSFHSNRLTGLCEDHRHRLWVVTEGSGLYEVDKKAGRMIPHTIRSDNAHRWNNQLSVFEDSHGMLWLSTYAGLAQYDPDRHFFKLYPSPLREMPIKTVLEDLQHRLWVGTQKGLYLVDRKTGLYTQISLPNRQDSQPVFDSFFLDKQQTLWLGSVGDGVFTMDLRSAVPQLTPYNPDGTINRYVWLNAVRGDGQGTIWVGTTDGLQRIQPSLRQVTTYRPGSDQPNSLSSSNIQAVYCDRAGTLWLGTDNGIDEQASNRKAFSIFQVKPTAGTANLPENKVNTVLIDQKNRVWLSNQHTVYRTDALQKQPVAIPPHSFGSINQHTNYIFSMLPNGSAGIWFATWDGLYYYDQVLNQYKGYPSQVPGQLISRGPDNTLWIGGEGGIASFNPATQQYTYYKYDPANKAGLPDKFVYALLASRTGEVWVSINGKGISRLDPKTGRFTHYEAGLKPGQLNTNEVLTFYEDSRGSIWAGANQGGLNRFDPRTGQFSQLTVADGLPSNRVVGIIGDKTGNLWVSTNKGLCRLNPTTKEIRSYDSNAGLPSNEFLENAVFSQAGQLYFGSLSGLVSFSPDSIQDNIKSFPVAITDFKVMNQSQPLTDSNLELAHDENFLSFEFAALTYTIPQLSRYAYRLVGLDETWNQSGTRHFANYTNLPPGTYEFQVKASTSDGIWTKQSAKVRFKIRSPWWATYWAYSVYLLLFGGAIFGYLRVQTERIRQRQEMNLRKREAEQLKAVDEVKNRFFANITHEFRTPLSLIIAPVEQLLHETTVQLPIRQTLSLVHRNAQQLLRLINQLLDLARLEATSMPVILKQGNVVNFIEQLIESFLPAAEQKGLTLSYTAEPIPGEQQFDADKWEKIVVNLVSNGIKFTPAGGRISVLLTPLTDSVSEKQGTIQLTVSDTGTGIPAGALPHIFDRFYQVDTSSTRAYEGTGIGLALVKELTELLGGHIQVESQLNQGTTFTLQLPVQTVIAGEPALPVLSDRLPVDTELSRELIASSTESIDLNANIDVSSAPLILLVDDNDDLSEFLAKELATTYRIITASNGQQGWQLTQAEVPDVVISDVMMPIMDGIELTQLIKSHPETDHIAVLLLTAKASQPSRLEGLEEGADDYLSKPFHLGELRLRLRNLINRQQKLSEQYRQQLAQPDAPGAPDTDQNPFLDRIHSLLEEHLSDSSLSVDWLADKLAMSRKTLYRKVDTLTQLAPNELIRHYRLRRAVTYLRAGHTSSETAELVGFKTASHFATVFKDYYKKTPTEFLEP